MTFLQLSTTYAPPSVGGRSVGYFASGTGAAGLVGAFLWWELRKFGVRFGVGISSVSHSEKLACKVSNYTRAGHACDNTRYLLLPVAS
jgi:hypothetical protein